MKLSWHIQKQKNRTRSKALQAAWAIIGNEDVTIFYLVKKLNHHKPTQARTAEQFALFNNQ